MSNPIFTWWSEDGSTQLSSGITLTAANGTPGTAVVTRLYNDKGGTGGSTTATEPRITAYSRPTGSGSYSWSDDAAANGWIECAVADADGNYGDWTIVGRARFAFADDLDSDEYRLAKFRLNTPLGAGVISRQIRFRVTCNSASVAVEIGHDVTGGRGIASGVGDSEFSYILGGGTVAAQGSPDDTVAVGDLYGIAAGEPFADLAHDLTFSNLDGNSVALGSGESYWAAVTLDDDGAEKVIKSPKGTTPLSISDRPSIAGFEWGFRAWVEVTDALTVTSGDVYTDDLRLGRFAAVPISGIDVAVHGGIAVLDDRYILARGLTSITLADDDENYLWLTRDGNLELNQTGDRPAPRATLLYHWTTASGAITATEDCRALVGPAVAEIVFRFDATLAGGQAKIRPYPYPSAGRLRVPWGLVAALDAQAAGAASGATKFDLSWSIDGGSTWTSFYPSSGSDDRRPAIAYNATDLVAEAEFTETFDVPRFCLLKASVVAVPTGGTAPSGATVALVVERPA